MKCVAVYVIRLLKSRNGTLVKVPWPVKERLNLQVGRRCKLDPGA